MAVAPLHEKYSDKLLERLHCSPWRNRSHRFKPAFSNS
jgi:hypothetical protein